MALDAMFEIAAMTATGILERGERALTASVGKLASGSRIPEAKDDVAATAISSRLLTSVETHNAINANIGNGLSLGQFAEATYAQTVSLLTRAKVLALQATSGNFSGAERALIDTEYQTILSALDRVAKDAVFNGIKVAETGIVPLVAATNFADGALPKNSFIPPVAGDDVAEVVGEQLILLRGDQGSGPGGPQPGGARGIYVNDTEFLTDGGVTANFNIQVGAVGTPLSGGGAAGGLYGGGFSFFLVDADNADFSGASPIAGQVGATGAGNLLYTGGALNNGFIGIGFESNGSFGPGAVDDDFVTVLGPESAGAPVLGTPVDLETTPGFTNGLDGPGAAVADGVANSFNIDIDITEKFLLNIRLTDNNSGATAQIVDDLDMAPLLTSEPRALKFGFGATILGLRNNFIVDDFDVAANLNVGRRMAAAALEYKATADTTAKTQQLFMPLYDATLAGLTLDGTSVRSQSAAEFAITRLDFALLQTVEAQAIAGAAITRFGGAQDFLAVKIENLERARSGLADLNIAREVAVATALQIQQASGASMIATANDAMRTIAQMVAAHDANATAAARAFSG